MLPLMIAVNPCDSQPLSRKINEEARFIYIFLMRIVCRYYGKNTPPAYYPLVLV
jgi:hypothetical protein